MKKCELEHDIEKRIKLYKKRIKRYKTFIKKAKLLKIGNYQKFIRSLEKRVYFYQMLLETEKYTLSCCFIDA